MIGKISIGRSFRGCLLYALNDKIQKHPNEAVMKGRAEVLLFNKCYGTGKELIQQFNEVRALNSRLAKPVMHITLSLAKGEKAERNELMEMSEACAREMGFLGNQFVAVYHRDTDHPHLHLVVNRIGFDGKAVSDSNNFQKIAGFCRKMEVRYNLQKVLSPGKFLSPEQRLSPRYDSRKEGMKKDIGEAVKHSRSYEEFERRMEARGYKITKGRGISFTDEKKVKVKGSALGYSLQTIERLLQKQNVLLPKTSEKNNSNGLPPVMGREVEKANILINQERGIDKQPTQEENKGGRSLLDELMKPEKEGAPLTPEWLRKGKRKRRQSRGL